MRFMTLGCTLALLLAGSLRADTANFDDDLNLRALGISADGPALVAFIRNRTATEVESARLTKLIEALGGKDQEKRRKAFEELAGLGPLAVPSLRAAANDPDNSAGSDLARKCLEIIQGDKGAQTL